MDNDEYKPESYFQVLFALLYGFVPTTLLRSDAIVLCVCLVCVVFVYFTVGLRLKSVETDKISLMVDDKQK